MLVNQEYVCVPHSFGQIQCDENHWSPFPPLSCAAVEEESLTEEIYSLACMQTKESSGHLLHRLEDPVS